MKNIIFNILLIAILSISSCFGAEMKAIDVYNTMSFMLKGEWTLSPESEQTNTTEAYKDGYISHLVGTDSTAIGYKLIAKGTTIQEDLFTGTQKQMVTMYHCNNFKNCTLLKATHYCAKQNQPEFLLNSKETTEDKIVFDCNMKTDLCNSNEDHVHKIIHELSDDGEHLKSSYLGWTNKKLNKKNSIYHFDKK